MYKTVVEHQNISIFENYNNMKRYINIKTSLGVETWETINKEDYKNNIEFKRELRSIKENYYLMGYNVYVSQRKAKF